MAVPQPDIDAILEELNGVRLSGKYLHNEIAIRKLRNAIEKMKDDYNAYHAHLASLYCITGDSKSMIYHGNLAMKNANWLQVSFHITTLTNAGFFTEARTALEKHITQEDFLSVDEGYVDESRQSYEYLVNVSIGVLSFEYLLPISKERPFQLENLVFAGNDLLKEYNIEEKTILSMMDVAGSILRKHEILRARDTQIRLNPHNKTINISIPINLPASEMVALEWEFANELFSVMPNAPFETVHVGFCCSE